MIEKPLIIIVFLYASSFGLLGAQYVLADTFGIALVNFEGVEIQSNLLDIINEDSLNSVTGNLNTLNQTTIETDPITAAGELLWDVLTILTGTYVFNLLSLLGVPDIIIAGMVIIYAIMLFRTLIALLRGI
jgi:hypothetical protein